MSERKLDFLDDVFTRHQKKRKKPSKRKSPKKAVGHQPALEIGIAQVTVEKKPPKKVFAAGQGQPLWPENRPQSDIQAIKADQVMTGEARLKVGQQAHLLVHLANIAACQRTNGTNYPPEEYFPTAPPKMIAQIRKMDGLGGSKLPAPGQDGRQLTLSDEFVYGTPDPDLLQTIKGIDERAKDLTAKYRQWRRQYQPLAEAMNTKGGSYFAEVKIVVIDQKGNTWLCINPDGVIIGKRGETATVFSIKSGRWGSKAEEQRLMALAGFYLPTIAQYDPRGQPSLAHQGDKAYPFQPFSIGKTTLDSALGRSGVPPPRTVIFAEVCLGETNPRQGITIQTFSRNEARTALKERLEI